ncbi:MAG: glycosyltransferase family 2 protein [Clostridia bacterium]|nr:glycosyltransferase family 2 protein [Clostridia bacterium]
MKISFTIVALNAASVLPSLLRDLERQNYPHDQIEVILIDSGSSDNTQVLMQRFAASSDMNVKLLQNPKKWLASGCNLALSAATGDAIIRIDAHAHIPPDFLEKSVAALNGQDIVGGAVLSTPPKTAREAVYRALDASRFCGGAASFRNTGKAHYVDALAYELCRRTVFDRTGPYDERLQRTEDNDMHYRMIKAGYRLYYDPTIVSWHNARNSLKGHLSQKWGNGVWIGRTLYIQPRCFAPRHLIPAVFALSFLLCILLIPLSVLPLSVLSAVYLFFDLLFAIQAAIESPLGKIPVLLLTPFLFPLIHFTYGFGTLYGLLTPVKKT